MLWSGHFFDINFIIVFLSIIGNPFTCSSLIYCTFFIIVPTIFTCEHIGNFIIARTWAKFFWPSVVKRM